MKLSSLLLATSLESRKRRRRREERRKRTASTKLRPFSRFARSPFRNALFFSFDQLKYTSLRQPIPLHYHGDHLNRRPAKMTGRTEEPLVAAGSAVQEPLTKGTIRVTCETALPHATHSLPPSPTPPPNRSQGTRAQGDEHSRFRN